MNPAAETIAVAEPDLDDSANRWKAIFNFMLRHLLTA